MVINEQAGSNKTLAAYKAAAALVPINGMASTMSSMVTLPSSMSTAMISSAMPMSTMPMSTTMMASMAPTMTTTHLPIFTGAAAREVGSMYGITGAVLAGLAFLV